MKKLLLILALLPVLASAQLTIPQGGTGTTTFPTNWVVVGNSSLRLKAMATSSLGLPTFNWPFTKQAGGEQATSTIMEFTGGLLSNASSTFTSNVLITGGLGVGVAETNAGRIQSSSNIQSGGDLIAASANRINWSNRSQLFSPANGQIGLRDSAETTGVGFDITTADTLKIRNLAQSADGNLIVGNSTSTNATTTNLYNSGVLSLGAGSASAPALTFDGSSRTGFYQESAGRFSVSLNGTLVSNYLISAGVSGFSAPNGNCANNAGISFINGPLNTGLYRAGTSQIGFCNAGVETMRWDSNNRVGVGTTTPSYKLSVSGDGFFDGGTVYTSSLVATSSVVTASSTVSGNFLAANATTTDLHVSNLASTTKLRANSAYFGNVGIDTTTSSKLTVQGDITAKSNASSVNFTVQNISPNNGAFGRLFLSNNLEATGSYADWIMYSSASTGNLFGRTVANTMLMYSDGSSSNGMGFGTVTADDVFIGTQNLERLTIASGGNVGVGTTTPGFKLSLDGTMGINSTNLPTQSGAGNVLCLKTDGAVVQDDSPITACSGASSRTVKHAITPLTKNLDKILKLKPVSYIYNKDYSKDQTTHLGFIAEDVEGVEPRLIDEGEVKGLKYAEFVSPIVGAIQEMWVEVWTTILSHESRLEKLEKENKELRARIEALEKN